MKRIIALFLGAILICSLHCFSSAETAEENPGTIRVATAAGTIGDTVDVEVAVVENPGFNYASLRVDYDHQALRIIEVTFGNMFGSGAEFNDDEDFASLFRLSGDTTECDTLFVITFLVLENANEINTVTILFEEDDISNENEDNVPFNIESGAVHVHPPIGDAEEEQVTFLTGGKQIGNCPLCGADRLEDLEPAKVVVNDEFLLQNIDGKNVVSFFFTIIGKNLNMNSANTIVYTLEFSIEGADAVTKTVKSNRIYRTVTNRGSVDQKTAEAQNSFYFDADYMTAIDIRGVPSGQYSVTVKAEVMLSGEVVSSSTNNYEFSFDA